MGLKCSLLGHAFDERDVVQERDASGSQVVTVVKDVERCSRCGATRVVSTNKEVVSAASATADGGVDASPSLGTPGRDAGPEGGPGGSPGQGAGAKPDAAPVESFPAAEAMGGADGAADSPAGGAGRPDAGQPAAAPGADAPADEFAGTGFEAPDGDPPDAADATLDPDGAAAAEQDLDPTGAAATEPATGDDPDGDRDPTEEDAEILGSVDTRDRAPGRWPGDETPDAWEPTPLTDDETDGAAERPADGDASGEAAEGAAATEAGAVGAAAPADGESESDGPEAVDDGADATTEDTEILGASGDAPSGRRDATGGTPDTVAEPAPEVDDSPEPAATATFTVPSGEYRCHECGHRIDAASSYRIGDACPECLQGYLAADD